MRARSGQERWHISGHVSPAPLSHGLHPQRSGLHPGCWPCSLPQRGSTRCPQRHRNIPLPPLPLPLGWRAARCLQSVRARVVDGRGGDVGALSLGYPPSCRVVTSSKGAASQPRASHGLFCPASHRGRRRAGGRPLFASSIKYRYLE